MVKVSQHEKYTIVDYSADELDQIETWWRSLECGADMTAFQSFDWYKNLRALYKQERIKNLFREWRYIAVVDGQKPLLIMPIQIQKFGVGYKNLGAARGIYFIGRQAYTDYLNFIYDTFYPDALQTLISYVSKNCHQRKFVLERMLESSASYQYLSNTYKINKIPVNCAALFLPETFEEYKKLLSKSTRQNIRTAVNRANKNGILLTHEFVLDEDLDTKEQIIRLNEQRLKKKNASSRKEMSFAGRVYCFFSSILRRIFSATHDVVRTSKNTFCFLVNDGDRLVSFFWGIRNDYLHEYYVILAGVDKEYEWYSPNISHLYLYIEEYYQEERRDIKVFDFTRGAEGYKKTIGCKERPVSGVVFENN